MKLTRQCLSFFRVRRIVDVHREQLKSRTYRRRICPSLVNLIEDLQVFPRANRSRGPEIEQHCFATKRGKCLSLSIQVGKRKIRRGNRRQEPCLNYIGERFAFSRAARCYKRRGL